MTKYFHGGKQGPKKGKAGYTESSAFVNTEEETICTFKHRDYDTVISMAKRVAELLNKHGMHEAD